MRKVVKISAKGIVSLTLAGALIISGINMPVGKESVSKELVNQSSKSVYNEIQKSKFSTEELIKISESALVDGEGTAKEINTYEDKNDFEAAVNYAMTAYYESENFAEMAEFEKNIDDKSSAIIEGYKAAAVERAAGDSNGYEAGTVLLSFDKSTSKEEIEAVVEAEYGKCRKIFECFNGDYMVTVDISLGQTVDMATEAFNDYSVIEVAGANEYLEVASDNATDYINDLYRSSQYYLNNMNVKKAWDYVRQYGFEKVLVGVIDSGINLNHEDLKGIISPKSAAITGTNTEPVLLSEVSEPYHNGHGTQVAGVIAAKANNSVGVAGVASCYNNDVVEILAVRSSRYNETYSEYRYPTSYTIEAIDYCVEQGVKVINYSASGGTRNTALYEMIEDAKEAGVIFVCSAGNNDKDTPRWPSDEDNTISVVATNKNNELASFSSYGLKKDFAAPGDDIRTTNSTGGYTTVDGTSFSSPAVAAVVAMMCSQNSAMNFDVVYDILAETSVDIGLGDYCKYGLVDAYAAVKAANEYGVEGEIPTVAQTEPITTAATTSVLEVIGAVVSSPADNTIGVVWGQDSERIEKKYKYNVYVNGEKKLSLVDCNYYTISGVNAGTATVKITAVLNSVESAGVTQTVNVNGTAETTTVSETTTVQETTTKAPETTTEVVTTTKAPETTTVPVTTTTPETTSVKAYTNVALNKTVTVASTVDTVNAPASNVVDGKNGTYWTSAATLGQWVIVDLGKEHFVDGMNILYNKFITATYEILISNDGANWTSIASSSSGTINSVYENMGLEDVRYVKLYYPNNTTNISICEIKIMGEEVVVETTTVQETTTVGVAPLEVIGALVTSPADNTVSVVWGQDGERIASGCKYNVYINGELKLSQVDCNAYTITDVGAGNATVKITAVLNGVESAGVSLTVTVAGVAGTPIETTTVEEATTSQENINLAVGKATYASSNENDGLVASFATDGDVSTRWSSAWSDNEWIYVNLGENKYISYVELDWEAAYATGYQIQISSDGVNWTTVNTVTNGAGGKERIDINRNASYVKLQGVSRSTTYGYSLYEMSVFGY